MFLGHDEMSYYIGAKTANKNGGARDGGALRNIFIKTKHLSLNFFTFYFDVTFYFTRFKLTI